MRGINLSARGIAAVKAVVFVVALLPALQLAYQALWDVEALGANPAETLTRSLGDWTLRLLLLTLAVTPVRKLLGWPWLARVRRMLGLYVFFYALLHFTSYAAFDQVFDFGEILRDIAERPFITVGVAALLLLMPLAATSTNGMVRRLGGANWVALHRLVYVIAVLGVVHFWMMVKRDVTEPAIYAFILAVLLGYRVWEAQRKRRLLQATAAADARRRTAPGRLRARG
ncbi:MAG TPA: protein-methionine-sulfoxide reductase heme-binding subunit MsrQ [Burkholderiales bacterium]|nr:protein-methionine-sulfoxide reductase heme-binding subunit MsrQ [Burkholderiales bacterium]